MTSKYTSKYTLKNGFDNHALDDCAPAHDVGELIELLQKLPPELPINVSLSPPGVKPIWFNLGRDDEGVSLEYDEDCEDEDDCGEDCEDEDFDNCDDDGDVPF